MKTFLRLTLLTGIFSLLTAHVEGATTILSDTYTVTTSGTGFALNAGVNTGINPPTTRLTGTAAANLRYFQTVTNKPGSVYDINSNRIRVQPNSNIGRFTLSANGTTPFDFSSGLGTASATPANPLVYDVAISMRNDASSSARFSFGLATAEGDINNMDFAVQVYRASSGNNFYTIQKRIDKGSWNGATTTDGTGDINATMVTASANTVSNKVNFLIRVTDAGPESGANYNSRVQVSTNGGTAWIYDTDSDAALTNGFRFDAAGRYFLFDIAGNTSASVYYDGFSVTWNSGPRTWNGAGANGNWNNATNWSGATPVNGSALIFNGTTRPISTNDISSLSVPWLKFDNGGFSLYGNALTVTGAITNTTGDSSLNTAVTLGGALKIQSEAGTLTLDGNLSNGAQNLTVDGAGNTTASGIISGTGSLTKNGTGLLELSGASANTLSGSTLVNAGTLSLSKTAGVNAIAGNLTIGDGTGGAGADIVQLNAANQISDAATVTVSASGSLDLNGFDETVASVSSSSASSQIALGAGTLTVSSASANTFAGNISGTGNLVKQGTGTMTLTGANTYSGNTTLSAGTLALGTGGSISSSPTITIANATTLDVSAISYSVGASQTLARNATSGSGSVNGSVTFDSGASVALQADGTGATVGSLSVAGNLTLNGNAITINVTGSALGAITNTLISYTGSKSGSFNTTPTFTGSGLAPGMTAQIVESAGQIQLQISVAPMVWSGNGANGNWSSGGNWAGLAPVSGDSLTFNGTTRQTNTNDISGLNVPSVTFNNGGFSLFGNALTLTGAITNLAGNNTLNGDVVWGSSAANTWSIASGSEIILNNTTTIETNGDHTIIGGGTLRELGAMNIGVATTANPAFIINEGKHIVDGGSFASRGGYRIGSLATGSGAQLILTNGGNLTLSISAGNLRVGDSANANASRLLINNSTVTMSGGLMCIPFAAGAIGEVNQTGGTVSGCIVVFNDSGAGTGTYTIKDGTLETEKIREDFTAGSSAIYFDNATLRTASGASATFMTGIDTAQIQSGGLTLDITSDVTVGQALTGTGALTKTGGNEVTLTGANTYSGDTTISAGTLALGVGGSIANSPNITIANGTTFDVSAIAFSLGASQTIVRNATSGSGSVNGSVTLASGAKVSLQATSSGSVGTLSVAGDLTLNGNLITINISGGALDLGTYPLITYTGAKSGSFNTNATITGSGIVAGKESRIVETNGQISLEVYTPGIPAHGVAAASLKVVENNLANTTSSVTVTATMSINGLQVRDGSSRGDYTVQVESSGTDDVNSGVLVTSVAENGKDQGEDSGINYCTSAVSLNSGGYFIPTSAAPGGSEYNINVSAAYFPYAKYLGGYARNSAGTAGGPNNLLTSSSGINLGTQFVDNGGGLSTVDLTGLGINSQTDGVLIVSGGGNNNEYATSKANTDGTWTVYVKDNGTNGATTTQGPVAFAFVPTSNASLISGKFQGDGTILMYNGTSPRFSVTNTTNGTWKLTIPGYSSSKGVLVVSAEGGGAYNQDNIVSAQPSGSDWIIQSRDLPGLGLQTPPEAVASFVFIPAPTATLVAPANNATVSSSPTLTVSVTNNIPGNLTVTFYGHRAAIPGPGPDFLIPALPDTQNYARESSGSGAATKEMWFAQTDWIVANRFTENIPFVATLGDCVNNADQLWQWRNATNAMYRLEKQSTTQLLEGIPYGITVGNHDQDPNGDENGSTAYYNEFFGTSHFSSKSYFGDNYSTNNDSWYDFFSAGGMDFMVISFEFGRYGDTIMDWARNAMAANPTRRVIVLTHFAAQDVADVNATTCPFGAQGEAIYTALRTNANFFLMMSGHVFDQGGEGRRTDTYGGHTIRTLVSDYQGRFNGGNGLMRLVYFSPSNNLVSVKTYSPYTGNYETDANSQFSFSYNMQPNGAGSAETAYVALGTNANVAPGSQSSFVWSSLQASKPYEWYVKVTDENGDYSTSSEWKFTTTSGFAPDANPDSSFETWSSAHGLTADPDADDDGDGQSNLAEYIANTNPKDAESLLKIIDAKRHADGLFTVTWSSVGGTRSRIQYSDSITGPFTDIERDETIERDAAAFGQASTQSFTDTLAPTNTVRYYRVKIVP